MLVYQRVKRVDSDGVDSISMHSSWNNDNKNNNLIITIISHHHYFHKFSAPKSYKYASQWSFYIDFPIFKAPNPLTPGITGSNIFQHAKTPGSAAPAAGELGPLCSTCPEPSWAKIVVNMSRWVMNKSSSGRWFLLHHFVGDIEDCNSSFMDDFPVAHLILSPPKSGQIAPKVTHFRFVTYCMHIYIHIIQTHEIYTPISKPNYLASLLLCLFVIRSLSLSQSLLASICN
jgi:hypothetical protein